VITVIGVLAAISIIGFGAWRTRVATTEVKSDLLSMKAGMEDARNRNNGYPVYTANTQFTGTNTTKSVFTQSKYVRVSYMSGSSTTYCVNAQSLAVTSVAMFINLASTDKSPQNGTC